MVVASCELRVARGMKGGNGVSEANGITHSPIGELLAASCERNLSNALRILATRYSQLATHSTPVTGSAETFVVTFLVACSVSPSVR